MTSSFLYFAYGSNMLTARLHLRCPSARPIRTVHAHRYRIVFCKQGLDGSGKASLSAIVGGAHGIQGILYLVELTERPKLDEAERNYDRDDKFEVCDKRTGEKVLASTYIAQNNACREDLLPFDWYVSLMVEELANMVSIRNISRCWSLHWLIAIPIQKGRNVWPD